MFFLPGFITQSMSEDEMKALVLAHWNKFQLEEAIRMQEGDVIGREANEIGQLQLAIHKLERVKMEVTCYSDAIRKAANALCSWWVRLSHNESNPDIPSDETPESCRSPT
jgi:hypothetical protein